MRSSSSQTNRERRVKTAPKVRRSSGPTIAQAAARALGPLVEDVEKYMARLGLGKGSEKRVHKLRAALRKIEALAGTLGWGFEDEAAGRLLKAARRVRRSAGSVRDIDVAAASIRRICIGEEFAAEAERVLGILESRRAKHLARLIRVCKEREGTIRDRLRELVGAPEPARARLPARCAAVVALARESSAMNDAIRAGLGTPELLHALRLNLKEARTVLETLGATLGDGAKPLAEMADELSDAFGTVNDLATLTGLLAKLEHKGSQARRRAAERVGAAIREAHAGAHAEGVVRARTEAARLAADLRRLIFSPGMLEPVGTDKGAAPPGSEAGARPSEDGWHSRASRRRVKKTASMKSEKA